jgi:hypothetical protein
LDIEVAFSKGPSGCLSNNSKGLWKYLFQGLPPINPLSELRGLSPELIIV